MIVKKQQLKPSGRLFAIILLFVIIAIACYQPCYKPEEIKSNIFILDKTLIGHTSDVWTVKFSPDGNLIASGSVDSTVRIYNRNGALVKILHQPEGITYLDFSPGGKYLATGSYDGKVRLWTTGGILIKEFNYNQPAWTIAFSPDGKTIAAAGEEKNIKLWDVESGKLITVLSGHQANVWCIKFSNDGNKIVSGSFDKTIKMWDVKNHSLIKTLTAHTQAIVDLAVSPDDESFASASDDKTIKVWNINSGKLLASLKGGDEHVQGLAYSPEGKWLVSSGRDKAMFGEFLQNIFGDSHFNKGISMRLWDMQTHTVVQTFSWHANDVNDVAFSPDGIFIASASSDKTVCLWRKKH